MSAEQEKLMFNSDRRKDISFTILKSLQEDDFKNIRNH